MSASSTAATPRLGVALGGGSARGWAHIGVLSALEEEGIGADIVCGTSIGALVGGIYAAGKLGALAEWVGSLTRREVFGLVDLAVGGGGMISGRRLMELYRQHLGDVAIEQLPKRFAAVATDLRTGAEVWLQEGSLLAAVRASISIPGLFTPVLRGGRWLVDGALVNPVPVNLCRALGAELVIAVDLLGPGTGAHVPTPSDSPAVVRGGSGWRAFSRRFSRAPSEAAEPAEPAPPGMNAVIATSLDIMQARISRSRLAGDPPDLLLAPRVRQLSPLEFADGQPTIDEGYDVVRRMLPALRDLLDMDAPTK
jgi:NTE family protein